MPIKLHPYQTIIDLIEPAVIPYLDDAVDQWATKFDKDPARLMFALMPNGQVHFLIPDPIKKGTKCQS